MASARLALCAAVFWMALVWLYVRYFFFAPCPHRVVMEYVEGFFFVVSVYHLFDI